VNRHSLHVSSLTVVTALFFNTLGKDTDRLRKAVITPCDIDFFPVTESGLFDIDNKRFLQTSTFLLLFLPLLFFVF